MDSINPQAFEYAVSQIRDGFIFERFVQDLLCQIQGIEFVPLGGVHDRGMDGLEHCSEIKTDAKTIYQISIEQNPRAKIDKTLKSLKANGIQFERLFYVTNQVVEGQDKLEEEFYTQYQIPVRCRDTAWLRGNINKNEGTVRTYLAFIEAHYHQFSNPGDSKIICDFERDPRLFVFLRQQWAQYRNQIRLDDLLADSLIVFALEGTDPDKNLFLSRDEISNKIAKLVSFPPKTIEGRIDKRLAFLSEKPHRRINFHPELKRYCLPYSTRLHLEEQNLEDRSIYEKFLEAAKARLQKHLTIEQVEVKDALALLESTFNTLFKQQGLEFADFVTKAENNAAVEKSLPDLISEVVESSAVIAKNRQSVKAALLGAIREIIYQGDDAEREFLHRLSNSYMMLFLLQCDPKICSYFNIMASQLKVFVCNSILVPVISEQPLEKSHRRHWNLLVNANRAGVRLRINQVILTELVAHIRKAHMLYEEEYKGREEIFSDMAAVPYVKEILLRSYFYARASGRNFSFDDLLDNFVTVNAPQATMEAEILEWLHGEFGIQYVDDSSLGIKIEAKDLDKLAHELQPHKNSQKQAFNDSRTILSVYALREKHNEAGTGGIFGYQTWWLSKDTVTQRAVSRCFGSRYATSCYIRPDFLLNYISLAPTHDDANRVFDTMFPTLMGVTISHHIPEEVSELVHSAIKEHAERGAPRVRAILRTLSDKLKTSKSVANRQHLKHFLDEEFKKS
jgi:hypothetical protein